MNHQSSKSIKNRTVMTTLTKIIVSTILALTAFSCNFDFNIGIDGDGNVVTTQRELNGSFSEIRVSRGLDVILNQGSSESVSVEADENLQDIIVTEIDGNILKITTTENIRRSSSKKVFVSFDDLTKIETTSGSQVSSENNLDVQDLKLETSSGSQLKLTLKAESLECDSSSGSNVTLSGIANRIYASASSGSGISASDLETKTANVKASSGANVSINTSKELTAKASSGGNISYYGNPEVVNNNESVSGSVISR